MWSRSPLFKRLPPAARAVILSVASAVLLFVLLAALSGIIGSLAYLLFLQLGNEMLRFMQVNSPLWVGVFPSWLILIAVIVLWLLDRTTLRRSVESLRHERKHMINLDETLVRCAPQLLYIKSQDQNPEQIHKELEKEVQNIVWLLLKQSTEAFRGDVNRAFLLLPDATGQHLKVWKYYGGDPEDIKRKSFYIGEDLPKGSKRGIAGQVFYERKLIVTRIVEDPDKGWKPSPDNGESYICFDEPHREGERLVSPKPPYKSFVCVPLIVEPGSSECLGVVCFDSHEPTVFDLDEFKKDLLFVLAARLRAIIVIYREVDTFFSKGQARG